MVATVGGNPADERALISLRLIHCQAARPAGARNTKAMLCIIVIHMRGSDVVSLSLSARVGKQTR